MTDSLEILAKLVRVKGVTGSESLIITAVGELASSLGFNPQVSDDGVVIRIKGLKSGKRLLFCSHLDTVEAGEGWSVDPYLATISSNCLIGRGAVDARSQVVSMLLSAKQVMKKNNFSGELVLAFSIGEEGNHPSLPAVLDKLPAIDAAVVGEPTSMQIATSQRGLMILELVAYGSQEHAARAYGDNSIYKLMTALDKIRKLKFEKTHDTLGDISITPTRLTAGVADNVTAYSAKALLDVRTIPSYTHTEIFDLLAKTCGETVEIISDIWVPCESSNDELLNAAKLALPAAKCFASGAASDWAALQLKNIPAIKVGAGDCKYSHKPDERILAVELSQGIAGLTKIAENYLG